jgi:hypothetical protein
MTYLNSAEKSNIFFKDYQKKVKIDGFVRSHQICFRWLSKNLDIQGVVIFQVRENTYGMSNA